MSCDKRCFEPNSCWHDYEDCSTCPGADKGRPLKKSEQPEPELETIGEVGLLISEFKPTAG